MIMHTTLYVMLCNTHAAVIVLQGVTVFDLMKGVEQAVTRRLSRTGGVANISWKYVWQTYWLAYGQTRLEVKTAKLSR